MAKVIVITVDPKGNERIQTSGFAGEECLAASRPFELGLTRAGEQKTPEFYEADGGARETITVDH